MNITEEMQRIAREELRKEAKEFPRVGMLGALDLMNRAIARTAQKVREETEKRIQSAIDAPAQQKDIPPFPSAESSKSAQMGFLTGVAWKSQQMQSALTQDKEDLQAKS